MSKKRLLYRLLLSLVLLPSLTFAQSSSVEYKSFNSEALGQEKQFAVYLPAGYEISDRAYPAVYFLHGLFGSERRWIERGARKVLDQLIADGRVMPMVIAMPDGDNSFYVNSVRGNAPYEDYILNDFIPFIEKTYRVKPERSSRAISGVSMGGYGALMLAMRHPDLFSASSAHSAVLLPLPISKLSPRLLQSFQSRFFEAVFGNPIDEAYWSEHNPVDLAQSAQKLDTVHWYFDCGTEDRYGFFLGATKLHEVMDSAGVPHEYGLYPGGHGWDYVKTTLYRSMTFHSKHFE